MKIFLTGGTGFIGSHFINGAHQAGYEVKALKRPASTPRVALEKDPDWLVGSLDDLKPDDFEGCNVVVHLATHSANVPYDTLENCLYWNLIAPLRMFQAARHAGIDRFIVPGSCFEYGLSAAEYDYIPAAAPLRPVQTYPASKAAASVAMYAWAVEQKLSLAILRIFHVYGEGEAASRLWPSLKRAALSGNDFPMTAGEQIRDFIPVANVVEAFIKCLERDLPLGVPFVGNVGTGKPQTLREFAEYWWRAWGAAGRLLVGEVPYRDDEVMRYVPALEPREILCR